MDHDRDGSKAGPEAIETMAQLLQRPRVCHISTVHVPNDVRIVVRECRSLAKAGYEVHLVIGAPRAERQYGVHFHPVPRFGSRLLRMLLGPWLALHTALKTRARLYHYHDPELIGVAFVLRWIFRRKVVFDIHECVHRQIRSKPYLPRGCGWVVGHGYRLLERVLTIGQTKVVANDNSVPDYAAPVLVRNFPVLLNDLASGPDRFENPVASLVYVGAISEMRGALIYVELPHRLRQAGRGVTLTLIGEHDEAFGRVLREEVAARNLDGHVAITGRLDWDRAMESVSHATIGLCLLHPVSNYTTCLATKIIEYMMLGTPVLASAFDCWRPYVEGEQTGRMANPLDPDEVFSVCTKMLDDPESLLAMSRRGRQAVVERYHWDKEFEKLERCYETLLDA